MKFAQLIVYGVEGNPITKTEAARLAGYSDAPGEGSKLTNPNKYPLVCAFISNLRDEVREKYGISFEGHLEELGKIRDHIATSLSITKDDFGLVPFNNMGGLTKMYQIFGKDYEKTMEELNMALIAT